MTRISINSTMAARAVAGREDSVATQRDRDQDRLMWPPLPDRNLQDRLMWLRLQDREQVLKWPRLPGIDQVLVKWPRPRDRGLVLPLPHLGLPLALPNLKEAVTVRKDISLPAGVS